MKKIFAFLTVCVLTLGANFAFAQNDLDFNYTTTTTLNESDAEALAGLGMGMGIFGIIIAIIGGLIGLFFLVFWIMMLVDCIKREFPNRGVWLAVLIITFFVGWSWLASILYYFMVKKKNVGTMKGGSNPAAPSAPAAPKQ
ncbi:MAG: hypothetical protein PHN19_01525 [Patescibacteria group bacterium]|nr:hypothetical protein [Patescibacteria group bacterium]